MRNLSAIGDGVKFHMRQGLQDQGVIFKERGGVVFSPEEQGRFFQPADGCVRLHKGSQHAAPHGGEDGAFESLILHLNLVFILKDFHQVGIEQVGRNALEHASASEQTEEQIAKNGYFHQLEQGRQFHAPCTRRVDQDMLADIAWIFFDEGGSYGSAHRKPDQVHFLHAECSQ